VIYGLGGKDTLNGNSGDDVLIGGAGGDKLNGGIGSDWASYAESAAVTVDLGRGRASGGDSAGDKFSSIENLAGSAFNDILTGSSGNNILRGLDGNDILNGGAGADTFEFTSLTHGSDTVTDFMSGTDKVGLTELLDSAGLGNLDYATLISQGNLVMETGFFATGLSSNSASIQDTRIYIDVDGIGAGGEVLIATLEDTLTGAGDFLI